ncbi:MAG: CRISPR-associated endoribonuclease Cas6 [Bacillaceae bacterium]
MRVQLHFEMPEAFQISYRLAILSYIKESIRIQSNEYYQSFFIDNKQKMKPYAFGVYFHNIRTEGDYIHADSLKVTVSSSDVAFIILLLNGCQQVKAFTYKNMTLTLKRVELLREKNINLSQIWMQTISPILIESKEGKPLLVDDENFEREFNYITSKMIVEIEGRSLYQPLKILKHNLHKTVIKENFHQSQNKALYFTAQKGKFLLEGDPRDLMHCYQNGLGWRTGVGFGCIELL